MTATVTYPLFKSFIPGTGTPAAGYYLQSYVAGSSTPSAFFVDAALTTPAANPMLLDANGEALLYAPAGALYKLQFQDPLFNPLWTVDQVTIGGGSGGGGGTASEWVASALAPTFISATSFSVSGDQRAIFAVDRRTQSTNTGGTIYSTITASSFGGGITTVTVVNDSSTLDSGLSVVNVGILNPANSSLPGRSTVMVYGNTGGTGGFASGTYATPFITGLGGTNPVIVTDVLGEFNITVNEFIPKASGIYLVTVCMSIDINGATITVAPFIMMRKNATQYYNTDSIAYMSAANVTGASKTQTATLTQLVPLAAGDTFDAGVKVSYSAGSPKWAGGLLSIVRVQP